MIRRSYRCGWSGDQSLGSLRVIVSSPSATLASVSGRLPSSASARSSSLEIGGPLSTGRITIEPASGSVVIFKSLDAPLRDLLQPHGLPDAGDAGVPDALRIEPLLAAQLRAAGGVFHPHDEMVLTGGERRR